MDNEDPSAEPAAVRSPRARAWLLVLWFVLSFGALFFARELSTVTLLGWPLSYWLAAQGCVIGFLAIAAVDAALQRPPGRVAEPDAPGPADG